MDLFRKYGLPGRQYRRPGLILPSVGGTGTVGTALPTAFSYGSKPQLLVTFLPRDVLHEQLQLYLDREATLDPEAR